jgi:hypothetical protein
MPIPSVRVEIAWHLIERSWYVILLHGAGVGIAYPFGCHVIFGRVELPKVMRGLRTMSAGKCMDIFCVHFFSLSVGLAVTEMVADIAADIVAGTVSKIEMAERVDGCHCGQCCGQ